mmetsp:Transcript_38105/g.89205  ORF Transcript_38105/g.89205 Transcript_38105/m.89205 type:complete len:248 (-) Transcript_38105:796-1539(-)
MVRAPLRADLHWHRGWRRADGCWFVHDRDQSDRHPWFGGCLFTGWHCDWHRFRKLLDCAGVQHVWHHGAVAVRVSGSFVVLSLSAHCASILPRVTVVSHQVEGVACCAEHTAVAPPRGQCSRAHEQPATGAQGGRISGPRPEHDGAAQRAITAQAGPCRHCHQDRSSVLWHRCHLLLLHNYVPTCGRRGSAACYDPIIARQSGNDLHCNGNHGKGRPPRAHHGHLDRHVHWFLYHISCEHARRGVWF